MINLDVGAGYSIGIRTYFVHTSNAYYYYYNYLVMEVAVSLSSSRRVRKGGKIGEDSRRTGSHVKLLPQPTEKLTSRLFVRVNVSS
jgi:hypothetical protein